MRYIDLRGSHTKGLKTLVDIDIVVKIFVKRSENNFYKEEENEHNSRCP